MMAWKDARNVRKATEEPVVRLGTDIQKWIADRLIDTFDEVVKQGVPDRFVELLKQLDDHNNDEGK
jgi:Anti-sigma factor NepR